MATERNYFGTDGIRGAVGTHPITADFMLKLGWAVGRVLGRERQAAVVIGKDTRISGYMFESALEAGLSAAGVDIILLGPMPTPGVAYLTRTLHAQAGIVIRTGNSRIFALGACTRRVGTSSSARAPTPWDRISGGSRSSWTALTAPLIRSRRAYSMNLAPMWCPSACHRTV